MVSPKVDALTEISRRTCGKTSYSLQVIAAVFRVLLRFPDFAKQFPCELPSGIDRFRRCSLREGGAVRQRHKDPQVTILGDQLSWNDLTCFIRR